MARFGDVNLDVLKKIEKLGANADKIAEEMTKAAAEATAKSVQANAPSELKSHVKVSRSYKTPSDGGVNTKVYISGYLPFNSGRSSFSRRGKAGGKVYTTSRGIPAAFLAQVTEYGTSQRYTEAGAYRGYITKRPFFRKSFNNSVIEAEMLKVQEAEFRRLGLK